MSLVALLCLVIFSPQTLADSLDADGSTTSFNFSAGELKQKNFRANSGDLVVFAFSNSANARVGFEIVSPGGKPQCGYVGCGIGAQKDSTSLHSFRAKETGTFAITFNLQEATASGTVRLTIWNATQYGIQVKSSVTQVNFSNSEILKVINLPAIGGQPLIFGLANRTNSRVNYEIYGKTEGTLCGYGGCATGPVAGSTKMITFTPGGTPEPGTLFLVLLLVGVNGSGNVSVSLPSFTGTSATPLSSPTASPSPSISGSSTSTADSKVQTSVDQATRLASVATDAAVNLNTNGFNEKAYRDALDTINKAIETANSAVEKAKNSAKNAKDSAKDAAESQVKAAEKALEAAKSAKQAAIEAKSINSIISEIRDASKNTQISQVKSSSKSCGTTVALLLGALGIAGAVATAGTAAPLFLAATAAATGVAGAALC